MAAQPRHPAQPPPPAPTSSSCCVATARSWCLPTACEDRSARPTSTATSTTYSDPAQSASYGYDPLDRLTQAVLPSVTHGYGYDATGNRLSQTSGAATRSYTVSPTSNRLSAIAGSQPRAYTYDANGSVTADGTGQTFTYDARGRLISVTVGGVTTTYRLDPLGQRLRKTGTDDTLYHYDQQGRLISETAPDGTPRKDYVWLGEQPLALIH